MRAHPPREPAPRWMLAAMLALSLFVHWATMFLGATFLRPPELDVEFEVPVDVEFGTSEELTTSPVPPPVSTPAQNAQNGNAGGAAGAASDGGLADAAISDAGPEDAGVADAGRPARVRDAGLQLSVHDAGTPAAPTRLPPGAQIALRVDMARIRKSPVAADVRQLLAAIPDWKALLEGSGIDPIEQIDRLLIATPNLQRDKIVLAGRYLGGEQVVREAVARLGAAKGEPVAWHSEGNVEIAPWANKDATPRVIALLGPQHFAISRAEDLPRLLAIASVRAQRGKRAKDAQHPADALLSMEDEEGLSLEIEGAAQFVRRARRAVPDRLRISVVELPKLRAEVRGTFSYADEALAADAESYWRELRERYASNALVALLGLADPLEDATVEQQGKDVRIVIKLDVEQMRLIMGYVRELVAPPRPARGP